MKLGRLLGLLVCAALAAPVSAWAGADVPVTLTVNSTDDPGDGTCTATPNGCTLREAMNALDNGSTAKDQINISLLNLFASTITVNAMALPTIDEPLGISSTGVAAVTVFGNSVARVFGINTAVGDDVSFAGFTITGGSTTASGAGISSADADLTLTNMSVTGSQSTANAGGGVSAITAGSLMIQSSTISGNTASAGGGGVYTTVPAEITRSTVSGNHTTGGTGHGGGILNLGGNMTIESSTISGNDIQAAANIAGGGVFTTGPLTVRNSTIADNDALAGTSDGGGITASGADPVLSNTVVADNTAADQGPDLYSVAVGDQFQLDYSLIENTSGATVVDSVPGSNILNPVTGAGLGPLASNGGGTRTHLPDPGSAVLDRGLSAQNTDQRGRTRPSDFGSIANAAGGDGSDIGAVEVQIPPPQFTAISPASPNIDDTPTITGVISDDTELVNASTLVQLYTAAGCGSGATGPPTDPAGFLSPGITVDPVPHNATTTFYGTITTDYGTSLCSSGPFPNTISYTQADPPPPVTPVSPAPTALLPAATGQRAAALKRCKKKKGKARKKCRKRAAKLPA